jgi:hypothetical protein
MKKKLQPKRFYLSFEFYLRGPKRKKPSFSTTFVPTTENSLPDINSEEDEREYGIKLEGPVYDAWTKLSIAAQEFATVLKAEGEIE